MNELSRNLRKRVAEATVSLEDASHQGDDYLASVRVGELEDLERLATEHDIEIDGLQETIEAHTGSLQIVLPQDEASVQD